MEINSLISKAYTSAVSRGIYPSSEGYTNENLNISDLLMRVVEEAGEANKAVSNGKISDESLADNFIKNFDLVQYDLEIKGTLQEEIADMIITLCSICGYLKIDIQKFIEAKLLYNLSRGNIIRPDHEAMIKAIRKKV